MAEELNGLDSLAESQKSEILYLRWAIQSDSVLLDNLSKQLDLAHNHINNKKADIEFYKDQLSAVKRKNKFLKFGIVSVSILVPLAAILVR